MENARKTLEDALVVRPADLRAWIWSLAPLGKHVLVAAAASVMQPAIEAWRVALTRDRLFAAMIGDDAVLEQGAEAVNAWLRDPTTARIEAIGPTLSQFEDRLDFACSEVSGDGILHDHARSLAWCVFLTVQAIRWTDERARDLAAGDPVEEASRIAAGPAYEVAEAVHHYATETGDPSVVRRVVVACLAASRP